MNNIANNSTKPQVEIFTDGACKGNPGAGGWGAIIVFGKHEKIISGGEAMTTNNRMEMMAVIKSLQALTQPCSVLVSTDSKYLVDGMTKWIFGWQKNSWRTADKKPVKNAELWQQLLSLAKSHDISWQWVKGHAGHKQNERADQLASAAALQFEQAKALK